MIGIKATSDHETHLFRVMNSNCRGLYVVAESPAVARRLALTYNHILDEKNGTVYKVDVETVCEHEPNFGSSLKRALQSRRQAAVENKNGFAVSLGSQSEVWTPLTEVRE